MRVSLNHKGEYKEVHIQQMKFDDFKTIFEDFINEQILNYDYYDEVDEASFDWFDDVDLLVNNENIHVIAPITDIEYFLDNAQYIINQARNSKYV